MKTCDKCGTECDESYCSHCDNKDEPQSLEEEIKEFISESEKYLPVTFADKIFGFSSLAGFIATVFFIVLFTDTVNDPELEIVLLVFIAVIFLIGTVNSILPKWVWFFKLYSTRFSLLYGFMRPLFGLEIRKVVSRAAFRLHWQLLLR